MENVKEKLEKFWNHRYEVCKDHFFSTNAILNSRGVCYGAMMFCIENRLIKLEEIQSSWETMWNKYQELLENA